MIMSLFEIFKLMDQDEDISLLQECFEKILASKEEAIEETRVSPRTSRRNQR